MAEIVNLKSVRKAKARTEKERTAEANRAARNLARVTLQEAAKLNTLDLVQYGKIVVSSKALEKIIARANGGQS